MQHSCGTGLTPVEFLRRCFAFLSALEARLPMSADQKSRRGPRPGKENSNAAKPRTVRLPPSHFGIARLLSARGPCSFCQQAMFDSPAPKPKDPSPNPQHRKRFFPAQRNR